MGTSAIVYGSICSTELGRNPDQNAKCSPIRTDRNLEPTTRPRKLWSALLSDCSHSLHGGSSATHDGTLMTLLRSAADVQALCRLRRDELGMSNGAMASNGATRLDCWIKIISGFSYQLRPAAVGRAGPGCRGRSRSRADRAGAQRVAATGARPWARRE
jgi:hypothetical protein